MLVAVQPVTFLRLGHPHPWLDIYIIVYAFHVCIGVVDDIVLHVPHKAVAAEDIQGKGCEDVNPFIFGETAMRAVVHDVETDRRNHAAQQHTFRDTPKGVRGEEDEVDVNEDEAYHQDHRLYKKVVITGLCLADLLEIIGDPFFQFCVEVLGAGRKLWQRHDRLIEK